MPARHHRLLLKTLERVASGECRRLMVWMPPGSAKTRYASIVFVCWIMARLPRLDVIGASYNSEYAEVNVSENIISMIKEFSEVLGMTLLTDNRKFWRTSNRGQYRAAGARSGITGRRADLFIIDDPIKGREDADSPIVREAVWKWYRAEVMTRMKPGARIVIISTRWHQDDLSGRILELAKSSGGEQWEVFELPAIADSDDDALGRSIGDPLWPAWEDAAALRQKRIDVGEREWTALYQQKPAPNEGTLFKPRMMTVLDGEPICQQIVRAWDLASSQNAGADWTVGFKLGRTAEGRYVVLDVNRFRGGPDEVRAMIRATATADGKAVIVHLPEDPGQAGKQQVLDLTRLLAGYVVIADRETGSKIIRSQPYASQLNLGNVSMVRAPWNMAYTEELAVFPFGQHDDQVDASSGAFGVIGLGPVPMRVNAEAIARMRTQAQGGLRTR